MTTPQQHAPTFEDVWRLFQETARLMKERSKETERLMKESSEETERLREKEVTNTPVIMSRYREN